MDYRAKTILAKYINNRKNEFGHNYEISPEEVFLVWKCKTIQNYKYILISSVTDGCIFELTYNGDKNEWYLDHYKKMNKVTVNNTVVIDGQVI